MFLDLLFLGFQLIEELGVMIKLDVILLLYCGIGDLYFIVNDEDNIKFLMNFGCNGGYYENDWRRKCEEYESYKDKRINLREGQNCEMGRSYDGGWRCKESLRI